jgi:hypothetical protein
MAGVGRFATNEKYIIAGDMSNATPVAGALDATVIGPWIDCRSKKTIWAIAQWASGAPVGVWTLQFTADPDPIRDGGQNQAMGPTKIAATTTMTAAAPAGAMPAGGVYFESTVNAPWARWGYIRTSAGAAALNMAAGTKDL